MPDQARRITRSGVTDGGGWSKTESFSVTATTSSCSLLPSPTWPTCRTSPAVWSVQIEDVSDDFGALALQGPYAREILKQLAPEMEEIGYFHLTPAKVGNAAVTISRTGYTGDLGYEIWVDRDDAVGVWDALFEVAAPYGVIPAGQTALLIARIEAGLVLIDVDFYSPVTPGTTSSGPHPMSWDWGGCFVTSPPTTGPSSAGARSSVSWPTAHPGGRRSGSWSTIRTGTGSTTSAAYSPQGPHPRARRDDDLRQEIGADRVYP